MNTTFYSSKKLHSQKLAILILILTPLLFSGCSLKLPKLKTPKFIKAKIQRKANFERMPTAKEDKPLLANIFTDNMVLQRDMEFPVWGWAKPGTDIHVTMDKKHNTATADSSGRWQVKLGPYPAGGPHFMNVVTPKKNVVRENILIGDVWICLGQSNMQWQVAISDNPKEVKKSAKYPNIRLLSVPKKLSTTKLDDVNLGKWKECSPETVEWFSAVAYHFGQKIHTETGVPVGLIDCSVGGSTLHAWSEMELLNNEPTALGYVNQFKFWSDWADGTQTKKQFKRQLKKWEKESKGKTHKDPNAKAPPIKWSSPSHNDSDWQKVKLPQYMEWEILPDKDGIVWFRKTVDLEKEWLKEDLVLSLGYIDDQDHTFFNGELIGAVDLKTKNSYGISRKYTVPKLLIKEGKNIIAVRVFDHFLSGGLVGPVEEMYLTQKSKPDQKILLTGEWKYKPENLFPQRPQERGPEDYKKATIFFNAMLNPLIPYGIKGFIYYQGESNTNYPEGYAKLLPKFIKYYREKWQQGDFAFYITQLAGWENNWGSWPALREAQYKTSQEVPNSDCATAIDLGDKNDIHPTNKKDVGLRIASVALKKTYGKDLVHKGPTFSKAEKQENGYLITFETYGSKLKQRKDALLLQGFVIAGEKREFVPAWAEIVSDNQVLVTTPMVEEPQTVRYAWKNWPETDLYNTEGLPAYPFRLDEWPE